MTRSAKMAVMARGRRCLFLDISGDGIVGIDFRLGSNQAEWVKRGLTDATTAGQSTVAFMRGWVGIRRPGERVWSARPRPPADRLVTITVQAINDGGRPGLHSIRAATPSYVLPVRPRNGSDAAAVGAWPQNGIFGTQIGPNRNGQPSS